VRNYIYKTVNEHAILAIQNKNLSLPAMKVITGAAGFIGSCLVSYLNQNGEKDLILVDDFNKTIKENNLKGKDFLEKIDRSIFFDWLAKQEKPIWNYCTLNNVALIYASSAATYGDGSLGFDDTHEIVEKLDPLNLYGKSKNDFDIWALKQKEKPQHWHGLKFFNVYGPNEFHKNRMASVIFHTFHKITKSGEMGLFESCNPKYKDGEQLRDFIYVKDILSVINFLKQNKPKNGLYNLGTGKARTFYDLAKATFVAMDKTPKINFIKMPEDLKEKYQYFTEANINKLLNAGYEKPFYSLEDGISDYVSNYLKTNSYF